MEKLSLYSGDGKSKLTIGATLASNIEFGFTASSFVSASVICGSSEEELEGAHNIMQPFVQGLCMENHDKLAAVRDGMVAGLGKEVTPVRAIQESKKSTQKVGGPPKKSGTPKLKTPPKYNR